MIDQNKRDRPKPYIDRALDLLFKRYSFYIGVLEIGCMRSKLTHHVDITDYECCNDGHSTYLFARTGWYIISVDNNENHIANAEKSCSDFDAVEFVNMDAIEYAKKNLDIFKEEIGLLFLDAWDVDLLGCAEKHLEFYNTIKPVLNDDCLILIDDTDLYYDHEKKEFFPDETSMGGKGKLLIPELIKNGYEIVFNGRQTLLRKQ